MRLALLLMGLTSLRAQVYSIPNTIYPGSRLTIAYSSFLLGGDAAQPAPLPHLTITTQGREYSLPLIAEPFPPTEEINPRPPAVPVYLVPRDLPLGPATVRYGDLVVQRTVSSRPFRQLYVLESLSAYAHQQSGHAPIRRNRFTDPARPGDRVTLWGTGFDRVNVTVGGVNVAASIEHQTDGLDRIEFTLPDDVKASCTQLVRVNQNPATISVAPRDSATCPHHLGISPNDLLKLDRGQTIPISRIGFSAQGIGVFFGEVSIFGLPPGPGGPSFFRCWRALGESTARMQGHRVSRRR